MLDVLDYGLGVPQRDCHELGERGCVLCRHPIEVSKVSDTSGPSGCNTVVGPAQLASADFVSRPGCAGSSVTTTICTTYVSGNQVE